MIITFRRNLVLFDRARNSLSNAVFADFNIFYNFLKARVHGIKSDWLRGIFLVFCDETRSPYGVNGELSFKESLDDHNFS